MVSHTPSPPSHTDHHHHYHQHRHSNSPAGAVQLCSVLLTFSRHSILLFTPTPPHSFNQRCERPSCSSTTSSRNTPPLPPPPSHTDTHRTLPPHTVLVLFLLPHPTPAKPKGPGGPAGPVQLHSGRGQRGARVGIRQRAHPRQRGARGRGCQIYEG